MALTSRRRPGARARFPSGSSCLLGCTSSFLSSRATALHLLLPQWETFALQNKLVPVKSSFFFLVFFFFPLSLRLPQAARAPPRCSATPPIVAAAEPSSRSSAIHTASDALDTFLYFWRSGRANFCPSHFYSCAAAPFISTMAGLEFLSHAQGRARNCRELVRGLGSGCWRSASL